MHIKLFIMKRIALILCVIAFVGCSDKHQAQKVAEQALEAIGNGRYASSLGLSPYLFGEGSIFSNALENTLYAKEGYSEYLHDALFQTDYLFDEYVFIDEDTDKFDAFYFSPAPSTMYDISEEAYMEYKEAHMEIYDELRNSYKDNPTFTETESGLSWLEYKNVPIWIFRYKVDNARICTVRVAKLPREGYKVISFMYQI